MAAAADEDGSALAAWRGGGVCIEREWKGGSEGRAREGRSGLGGR